LDAEEALQLFSARARLQSGSFEVSDENVQLISQICRRLDGLPLAIELAAARVSIMPLSEILARLQERFAFLTGGERGAAARGRTLRAAIDWSFELLDPAEKNLFRRLSIFADRFSLESAERVCADDAVPTPGTLLAPLGGLIEKSMVVAQEGRYRCLETLRAYGREHLNESGEASTMARRLAIYLLSLAEGRKPGELAAWLDRVEAWHDDIVATLDWSLENDPEVGARLTIALALFFQLRGHASVPRNAADGLLRRLPAGSSIRAPLLHVAGAFTYVQGDLDGARHRLAEAVAEAGQSGDKLTEARALETMGLLEVAAAGETAEPTLQMALAIAHQNGFAETEAAVLHQLGLLAIRTGELGRAGNLLERSVSIRKSLGRADEASMPLTFLGVVAMLAGNFETARRAIVESLQVSRALRDRRAAWSLEVLACLESLQDESDLAMRLAAAGAAMHEAAGSRPPPTWVQTVNGLMQRPRESLGEAAADAAWAVGKRLTMNEAFELALAERKPEELEVSR
jgi:non-specific serine/threonine protein kinase